MRRSSGSSIRVSPSTRKRVGDLVLRLKAASQQDVIDRALDKLEHSLFWEEFEKKPKRISQPTLWSARSAIGTRALRPMV
jgi:hypothetical protein